MLWHRLCGLDCFSINQWQWTMCKCNSSDTPLLTNQFLASHFGFTPNFFHPHTHTIIPFVPHRITNQKYKIPSRSLFIYFAAKTVSLIFSILFFFPFFFFPLINGVSDFKCYTGPPQNQFESLKLSQHQTVKVKMHYCGPAFVTFFNTHVTSL